MKPSIRRMLDDLTIPGLTKAQYRLCEECELHLTRGADSTAHFYQLEQPWKEKTQTKKEKTC